MGGTTAMRGTALGRGDIVLHVVMTDALADPIGTLGPDSSKICPKLGRRGPTLLSSLDDGTLQRGG